MTGDARFEEGAEQPLRLIAQAADDLPVMSALLQDAVLTCADMRYEPSRRRFAALVSRFRWEDLDEARARRRPVERVRTLLVAEGVTAARSRGFDRGRSDLVLSLLSLGWSPASEGAGRLVLTLAGEGEIALDLEAVDLRLEDVSRPYAAPSGKAPCHPDTESR